MLSNGSPEPLGLSAAPACTMSTMSNAAVDAMFGTPLGYPPCAATCGVVRRRAPAGVDAAATTGAKRSAAVPSAAARAKRDDSTTAAPAAAPADARQTEEVERGIGDNEPFYGPAIDREQEAAMQLSLSVL